MPKPSAREFMSTSQKGFLAQEELKEKISALEAEKEELFKTLQESGGKVVESREVEIALIKRRPYKSRREKDPQAHQELVHSIRTFGFRGSIWVQRLQDGTLRLIAGESRLDAAVDAGLKKIPVDEIETDDVTAVKLSRIENVRRRNLNVYDDTKEILYLLSLSLSLNESEVVKLLYQMKNAAEGKAPAISSEQEQTIYEVFSDVAPDLSLQSFVTSRLRLLNLPKDVLAVYDKGKLAYTKALAIATVENEDSRRELLRIAIDEELSLEAIKAKIRSASDQQALPHPVIQRLEKSINQIDALTPQKISKMSYGDREELLKAITRMEQKLQEKKNQLGLS